MFSPCVGEKMKNYTRTHLIILAIFFLSQVVMSMGAYVWGPIAPNLKDTFSLTTVQIGVISSSLYFTAILFSIPSGISVDKFGTRKNLIICLGLMGGSLMILSIIGNNFIVLVLFASLSGIGYGMIYPVSSKGLLTWFNKELRATAFGVRQSGVTIGAAVTGVLAVYITQKTNYQTTLLVVGGLNLLMAAITLIIYPKPISKDTNSHGKLTGYWFRSLLNNKNLLCLSLIMALFCLSQSSIIAFFVLYLKEYLRYPIEIAAFFLALMMVTGSLSRVIWGIISDKVFKTRRKPVLLLICIIAVLSTFLTSFLTPNSPQILLAFITICIGASLFGSQGLTIAYIAEISESKLIGTSTSLAISIAWIGMVFGPVCFGGVVLHFGYSMGWFLLSFFLVLSLFLYILLRE